MGFPQWLSGTESACNAEDMVQEDRVGWEDPLEKGMATYSRILAWRIPRTEEPGWYRPRGRKQSDTTD